MADAIDTLLRLVLVALGTAPEPSAAAAFAAFVAIVAAFVLALVVAHPHLLPAVWRRVRSAGRERGTPAQSDPDAAGHPRPRAPGAAASAA